MAPAANASGPGTSNANASANRLITLNAQHTASASSICARVTSAAASARASSVVTSDRVTRCKNFNVARSDLDVHPSLRKPMIGQSSPERSLLEAFFGYGLVDVGRHVDPDNDRLFTWWAPWRNMRQRNIGWRLDYVAASKALVDETVHCVAYRDVGTSDHAPVIAHLRDTPAARPTDSPVP